MYDDLVKRLMESARERCYIGCFGICRDCKIEDLLQEAAEAIKSLNRDLDFQIRAAKAEVESVKPRWIPVTERLPGKNGSYLVYVYGEVTEMNCWHGKWHRLGDDYTKAVTHWMPLPEPPKESES